MWKFSWWSHSEKPIAGYCFTHLSKRPWKMVQHTCFWHLTLSSLRLEFLLCPVTAEPSSILHAPIATFCQHWLCLPVSSGCAMFLSHILGSHRPCSSYCSHSLLITYSTVRSKHSLSHGNMSSETVFSSTIFSASSWMNIGGGAIILELIACTFSSLHFFCIRKPLFVSLHLPRVLLNIYSVIPHSHCI